MKTKSKILTFFVLFYGLIVLRNITDAATCNFYSGSISSTLGPETGYICELIISDEEKLTGTMQINGNHENGKNDNDVTILQREYYSKFKVFPAILCQKFMNLEVIDFITTETETIEHRAIENCKNLKKIDFFVNKIRSIPDNFLANNQKLTHFSINSNFLTTFAEDAFANLYQLLYLDASFNRITFLPNDVFKRLSSLKILMLDHNKLKNLNPEWFENLRNLEEIYLGSNEIKELPANVFRFMTNLKVLELPENELTVIHSYSFGVHRKLENVDLTTNQIKAIDEDFIDNSAISILNMWDNDCSNEKISSKNEVKEKLRKCFENYRKVVKIINTQPRGVTKASSSDCGKSLIGKGNIIGGQFVQRGAFPWFAALVKEDGFFCGGTLVRNNKVITAAHCIHNKFEKEALYSRDIIVILGAYNLNVLHEIDRNIVAVAKIHLHPDWNPSIEPFDADIAILELARNVNFNSFIQVICLLGPNSEISKISTGLVIGYGKSEDQTKRHENILKAVETPIHFDSLNCFYTYPDLLKISSPRTLCGGTARGVGVCSGDSGGGLIVKHENIYYLRGIVSASLFKVSGCDVDSYSVFTDVLMFRDWINEKLDEPSNIFYF